MIRPLLAAAVVAGAATVLALGNRHGGEPRSVGRLPGAPALSSTLPVFVVPRSVSAPPTPAPGGLQVTGKQAQGAPPTVHGAPIVAKPVTISRVAPPPAGPSQAVAPPAKAPARGTPKPATPAKPPARKPTPPSTSKPPSTPSNPSTPTTPTTPSTPANPSTPTPPSTPSTPTAPAPPPNPPSTPPLSQPPVVQPPVVQPPVVQPPVVQPPVVQPPVTEPPVSAPIVVQTRPGNGYGDKNHDHSGPPGKSK